MSAYSDAHGPEAAVDLVIANDRAGLSAIGAIITEFCIYSHDQWTGIDAAAQRYRDYLGASALRANSDLAGVDLSTVDYARLVRDELQERNLQADRPLLAGL